MHVLSFLLAVFVLLIASTLLWFLSEKMAGKQKFILHFGNILLVTVLGAIFFLFWGWNSVAIVLGVFGGLWIIGSVMERFL
jgi:hypothetical protein